MKKVLIGFEMSQTVCSEFLKLGFDAYSCDLQPCAGEYPDKHLQMDIYKALDLQKWDFIGLHPTCTKMTLTGNSTYGKDKPRHHERLEAVEWTINLWQYVCSICDCVYMENPMGAMNPDKRLPKPQVIHPYYFGDPFQKQTCLWLKGLPHLYHNSTPNLFDKTVTHTYKGDMYIAPSGKKMPKWFAVLSTSRGNEKNRNARSKTFPGIARAMATQWGELLNTHNTHESKILQAATVPAT